VFAEDEARLLESAAATPVELEQMVDRRTAGEPLEHVLGWVEFDGARVAVDPGVFVPRRRSELLVRVAATVAPPSAVVVELCCGAAAIASALARRIEPAEIHAVDVDPAAVACARRNLGAGGQVYLGDLYAPLPARLQGCVDLLVANAPYVPTGDLHTMPSEARLHEPGVALDGGVDGLDVVRRIGARARAWLAPGGHLVVESSEVQADRVVADFEAAGLQSRVVTDDDIGATVVVASVSHATAPGWSRS
jgi:release factor glutamine methyltransferase